MGARGQCYGDPSRRLTENSLSTSDNHKGPDKTRAGYVAFVGRPNAGKSTLLNHLVGEHLSIVTAKAQTTWQRITGLLTVDHDQLIFLDTPGILETRDLLQRAMLGAALEALNEADVVVLVVDTTSPPKKRETASLLLALQEASAPVLVALNKVDSAKSSLITAWEKWIKEEIGAQAYLIAAINGKGIDELLVAMREALPEGPFLYPPDQLAADSERFFVGELVRETIFELFQQEIPYSVFCRVGEFREAQEPVYVQVDVYVERKSQKGMLIGKKGTAIRNVGEVARKKIETFLGRDVYLDLWVKPLRSWRKNRSHLRDLGFRLPPNDEA